MSLVASDLANRRELPELFLFLKNLSSPGIWDSGCHYNVCPAKMKDAVLNPRTSIFHKTLSLGDMHFAAQSKGPCLAQEE